VVVDNKIPEQINVNVDSCFKAEQLDCRAEHLPKSRGEDTSVSSATDPVVLPAVAPVLVPMPLLNIPPVIIQPVEIPHEEPLAIPGAWPDPVLMYAPPGQPPGQAPRRPL